MSRWDPSWGTLLAGELRDLGAMFALFIIAALAIKGLISIWAAWP